MEALYGRGWEEEEETSHFTEVTGRGELEREDEGRCKVLTIPVPLTRKLLVK